MGPTQGHEKRQQALISDRSMENLVSTREDLGDMLGRRKEA
jgi:hypothetical protein